MVRSCGEENYEAPDCAELLSEVDYNKEMHDKKREL